MEGLFQLGVETDLPLQRLKIIIVYWDLLALKLTTRLQYWYFLKNHPCCLHKGAYIQPYLWGWQLYNFQNRNFFKLLLFVLLSPWNQSTALRCWQCPFIFHLFRIEHIYFKFYAFSCRRTTTLVSSSRGSLIVLRLQDYLLHKGRATSRSENQLFSSLIVEVRDVDTIVPKHPFGFTL